MQIDIMQHKPYLCSVVLALQSPVVVPNLLTCLLLHRFSAETGKDSLKDNLERYYHFLLCISPLTVMWDFTAGSSTRYCAR